MDPAVDYSLRVGNDWLWPALSPDQQNTVTMRGTVIATSTGKSLIQYRGRLYQQTGANVTTWDGEAYPAKREERTWQDETTT